MNIEKWDSVLADYQSCIRMFTWHNLKIMSTMPLGVTLSFYPSSWLPSVLHSTENNQGEIDVPVGKLGRKWENHENRRNKDIFSLPHFTDTLYLGELFRKNIDFLAFFLYSYTQKKKTVYR